MYQSPLPAFRVPRPCLHAPPAGLALCCLRTESKTIFCWLCSTPRQGSAAETSPTLTSRRYARRYPAHSPASSTCPLASIALRVATHTGASIPDSVRILRRLRGRACKTHARSECPSRSRPACSRNSRSAHACGMEQHEILDAMHETIARSYLDLEIVLEDFMFVLLSIRFYIRIVAFCIITMTLFAFAAFLQTLPSVFQTEDFLTASLLRAHQHAATLHAG